MVRCALIGVMIGLLGAAPAAADLAWKPFNAKEGRFTVTFPDQPTETRRTVTDPNVVANVQYEAKRDDITYMAGYIAYAQATAEGLDSLDPADFATRQRQSTVKGTQGEVLSEKDVTVGTEQRPGYELLIKVSPQLFIRQRACYARGKLHQLMVAGKSQDAVTGPSASTFLDSFDFTE